LDTHNYKKVELWFTGSFLPVQIFVFLPITSYLKNSQEFQLSIIELLKLTAVPALALLLVIAFLFRISSQDFRSRIMLVILLGVILTWAQANVLLWNYGALDGTLINWDNFLYRGWIDGIVWCSIIALAIVFRKGLVPRLYKVSLVLMVIQLLSISVLLVSTKGIYKSTKSFTSVETFNEISNFSKRHNIIHIVLDGSQSDIFQNLFDEGRNSQRFRDEFSGFTVFPENLGTFPYTQLSVPNFLSGKIYKNNQTKDAFINAVMSGKNILNAAVENNYELDVATGSEYFVKQYSKTNANNVLAIDSFISNGPIQEASLLFDIALFQAVPHFLKPKIYNDQDWLFSALTAHGGGLQHWYFQHTLFIHKLIENIQVTRESPVYKYFHIMNTHEPMIVAPDCGYIGGAVGTTKTTFTVQSRCSLETLILFIRKLKEERIFDNSFIIIHGDHGGWVANGREGQRIILHDNRKAAGWVSSLASPFLAIKLPNANNQFTVSSSLSSLSQIAKTIVTEMAWPTNFPGQSVFGIPYSLETQREFYLYAYGALDGAWEAKYTAPILKYLINGSHLDAEWKLDKVFPPLED